MGLEKQGSKPSGKQGKWMGVLMNKFHTPIYTKYFRNKNLVDNCKILDLGCGGGKFIHEMAQINPNFELWGLDHSKEMIELSSKLNLNEIKNGRIHLLHSNLSNIDLAKNSFDLITAFETIQFWDNIPDVFTEIFQLLNQNGEFIIINRYPKEVSKWWKMAKIKSDKEYNKLLLEAGFSSIDINLRYKKHWIIVSANKNAKH